MIKPPDNLISILRRHRERRFFGEMMEESYIKLSRVTITIDDKDPLQVYQQRATAAQSGNNNGEMTALSS